MGNAASAGAPAARFPARWGGSRDAAPAERGPQRGSRDGGPECQRISDSGHKVRLGAVGYLNARPLVYGLEGSPRFDLRYDVPAECARLLHARQIDVGLIPSIEYLRGPGPYAIV